VGGPTFYSSKVGGGSNFKVGGGHDPPLSMVATPLPLTIDNVNSGGDSIHTKVKGSVPYKSNCVLRASVQHRATGPEKWRSIRKPPTHVFVDRNTFHLA